MAMYFHWLPTVS